MANYQLKFIDIYDDNTIEVWNTDETISICINEFIHGTLTESLQINLDKSTAIKFAKTLRTEINKITESEGING